MTSDGRGFSMVELAVAAAVAIGVAGIVVSLAARGAAAFTAAGEVADMQQRARVVATTLARDIGSAGAGPYWPAAGDLPGGSPPLAPYRAGADPPGTFRPDTITVWRTTKTGAIVPVTYWLKADAAANLYQLMLFDGTNPDVPVVDHVVGLRFDYFGDPQPPRMRRPLADPAGPWTTYGPKPPVAATGAFAPGENCVFADTGSGTPTPRLEAFGPPAGALTPLGVQQLTDGPWCPDDSAAARWDADLLRIRKVAVAFRIEAAIADLRGPAGALFARAGTSRDASRWAPDLEVRMEIAPRNLLPGR